MTEGALLAIVLAAIAGVLAGRSWAAAQQKDRIGNRVPFRTSPHYLWGLHYLTRGERSLALSELSKVTKNDPTALEVDLVRGGLLREMGQVERAIQVHQKLLANADLTRAERAYTLASLGVDFRRAGFVDRASETLEDALSRDPQNMQALVGLQKLHEDQQHWREAYDVQTRLSRLRKTDDSLVLGFLQAAMGDAALRAGDREGAERSYRTALSLDTRVLPAHLGLADLALPKDPGKAAAILEEAIGVAPEKAYLCFPRLSQAYQAQGEPSRFLAFCEAMIQKDPRDWRARLAVARQLRDSGEPQEALGLLLKALAANPQVLVLHLEAFRTLKALGVRHEAVDRYVETAEASVVYADPHICTTCRYRADDMLWRCPHCHEWGTFVEERLVGATN
jgi:lipopolysaccharide biosynthesis regulator YciM